MRTTTRFRRWLRGSQKGSLLVLSYMLVAVVTAWVAATFQMGITGVRLAEDKVDKTQAFHIAEAGLNRTIVNMRNGDTNSISSTSYADSTYAVTVTQPSSTVYKVVSQGNSGTRQQSIVEAYIELLSDTIFDYSIFAESGITLFGSTFTDSYNECVAPYDVNTAGDNVVILGLMEQVAVV